MTIRGAAGGGGGRGRRALYQVRGLLDLQASRYRSPETLRGRQTARLRRLLAHAAKEVPYHRDLWREAGIRPEDVRSFGDLTSVPETNRAMLQARAPSDLHARSIDPDLCRTFATSGTTGHPLTVIYRPEDETIFNLTWIRAYLAGGLRPWDRLAAFQGDGRDRTTDRPRRWYGRLGLWERTHVSTWDTPEGWLRVLDEFQPNAIVTDAGTYRILAEAVRARGGLERPLRILFNVSVLLDRETRRTLTSTFGCPVVDLYGSFEAGCLAWECRACGGYHLNSDTAIVEILKDGREAGPGEEGEVVVTNLFSFAMPIIRYRLGDAVVRSTKNARCGWPFPLLESLTGRLDDILLLPNGRRVGPQPFHHIFTRERGIGRWRVVQESLDLVAISLEPLPGFDASTRANLEGAVADLFGTDVRVVWSVSEALPAEPGAKSRAVFRRPGVGEVRP